jgi:hypothetical protein
VPVLLGRRPAHGFDFPDEQRDGAFEVFAIDASEDSAQECARAASDIYRKANRGLTGLVLRENVIVENL